MRMYSRPKRIPATINQICEATNALIKVVEPSESSKTGQAADARATYKSIESRQKAPTGSNTLYGRNAVEDVGIGNTIIGADVTVGSNVSGGVAVGYKAALNNGGKIAIGDLVEADAETPIAIGSDDATKIRVYSDGTMTVGGNEVAKKSEIPAPPDLNGYALKSELDNKLDKAAVDSSLSSTSTNPVQNKVVKAAVDAKADQIIFPCGVSIGSEEEKGHASDGSQINIGKGSFAWGNHSIAIGHNAKARSPVNVVIGKDCYTAAGGFVRNVILGAESHTESVNDGVAIGVGHILTEDGEIAIGAGDNMDGYEASATAKANTIRVKGGVLTVGGKEVGGGNTEIWKGTIDSIDKVYDDMIGAKQLPGGSYPRLHARNKDIHGCTGFSNETDTHTGLRFVLPWDLAMSNDTSYLSPYVEWTGARGIGGAGSAYTTTFVQPLMPRNKGTTSAALPYAVPNFENSPLYWAGHIMYNDASNPASAAVKQVKIPWGVLNAGDVAELSVGMRKAGTTVGRYSHAEGSGTTANGISSHAEGSSTTASGSGSHAEGSSTKASGGGSHAEGQLSEARGINSHAEGSSTKAGGDYSHAEGYRTTASKTSSHAEGGSTTASGTASHAEGSSTTASGTASHAEGQLSEARGINSHAEGVFTIAQNQGEHAQGRFNKSTELTTLHSVGIGTSGADRKNAEEITNAGKLFVLGVGGYDGTNPTAAGVSDLATAVNAKLDKTAVDSSLDNNSSNPVQNKVVKTAIDKKRDKTDLTADTAGFPTAAGGRFTVSDGSGEVVDTLSLTGPATYQGSRYALQQGGSTDSSRTYLITSLETLARVTVTVTAEENYYKLFTLDNTELGLQAFSGTDTLAKKSETWLVGGTAEQNTAVGAKLGGLEIDASGESGGTGEVKIVDESGLEVRAGTSGFSLSRDSEEVSFYTSVGAGTFSNDIVYVENGVRTQKVATFIDNSLQYDEYIDDEFQSSVGATFLDIINTANGVIGLEAMFTAHPIEYVGSGEDGYTPPTNLPKARLMEARAAYADVGQGEFEGSKEIELYAPLTHYYYGNDSYTYFSIGGYPYVLETNESEFLDDMGDGSVAYPHIEMIDEVYGDDGYVKNLVIDPWGVNDSVSFFCGLYPVEHRTSSGIQFIEGAPSGLESESFDGPTYAHLSEGGLLSQVRLGPDAEDNFTIERTLCVGLGATDYGYDMNSTSRVFRVENWDKVEDEIKSFVEITCPVRTPDNDSDALYYPVAPKITLMGEGGRSVLTARQLHIQNELNDADIFLGAGGPTEDPGAILYVSSTGGERSATLTIDKMEDINEEMSSAPTQAELIECVKKLWTKFGGTIAEA